MAALATAVTKAGSLKFCNQVAYPWRHLAALLRSLLTARAGMTERRC
jgi:hypothetical protein